MIFLICFMLVEFLSLSYSAPKLGHLLFDPLTYEAAMFVKKDVPPNTSNDAIRRFLRIQDKLDITTKKPCLGYDYDDKLCKLMDDRIICGYNKNLGQPKNSVMSSDIGNGCYIRGDRVECGYIVGSYLNSSQSPTNIQDEKKSKNAQLRMIPEVTLIKVITEATTKTSYTSGGTKLMTRPEDEKHTRTSINTKETIPTTSDLDTSKPITIAVPISTTLTTNRPPTNSIKTKMDLLTTLAKQFTTVTTEKTILENTEQTTNTAKPRFMCVDKNITLLCYELNESKYLIYSYEEMQYCSSVKAQLQSNREYLLLTRKYAV